MSEFISRAKVAINLVDYFRERLRLSYKGILIVELSNMLLLKLSKKIIYGEYGETTLPNEAILIYQTKSKFCASSIVIEKKWSKYQTSVVSSGTP